MDRDTERVLSLTNRVRKVFNNKQMKNLPRGYICEDDRCPVARAMNVQYGLDRRGIEEVAVGMHSITIHTKTETSALKPKFVDRMEKAVGECTRVDTNTYKFKTPEYFRRWISKFDSGKKYQEYALYHKAIGTGPVKEDQW